MRQSNRHRELRPAKKAREIRALKGDLVRQKGEFDNTRRSLENAISARVKENQSMQHLLMSPYFGMELQNCQDTMVQSIIEEVISKMQVVAYDDVEFAGEMVIGITIPETRIRRWVLKQNADMFVGSQPEYGGVKVVDIDMFNGGKSRMHPTGAGL